MIAIDRPGDLPHLAVELGRVRTAELVFEAARELEQLQRMHRV